MTIESTRILRDTLCSYRNNNNFTLLIVNEVTTYIKPIIEQNLIIDNIVGNIIP